MPETGCGIKKKKKERKRERKRVVTLGEIWENCYPGRKPGEGNEKTGVSWEH